MAQRETWHNGVKTIWTDVAPFDKPGIYFYWYKGRSEVNIVRVTGTQFLELLGVAPLIRTDRFVDCWWAPVPDVIPPTTTDEDAAAKRESSQAAHVAVGTFREAA